MITMKQKILVLLVVVTSLCELTISADVASAFLDHEVVPDAVNVAPQSAIKVNGMKYWIEA